MLVEKFIDGHYVLARVDVFARPIMVPLKIDPRSGRPKRWGPGGRSMNRFRLRATAGGYQRVKYAPLVKKQSDRWWALFTEVEGGKSRSA